jgi:hypothetical protein
MVRVSRLRVLPRVPLIQTFQITQLFGSDQISVHGSWILTLGSLNVHSEFQENNHSASLHICSKHQTAHF